ncbi:MAG: hypothetical protein J6J36_01040 [Clostridia bacterium]|nr:hypothetical protein [Clostridia bacterium]
MYSQLLLEYKIKEFFIRDKDSLISIEVNFENTHGRIKFIRKYCSELAGMLQ